MVELLSCRAELGYDCCRFSCKRKKRTKVLATTALCQFQRRRLEHPIGQRRRVTFLVLRKCWSIRTRFEVFVDFRKAGHRQGDV